MIRLKKLRDILHIPKNYQVLFLQGGASLQFYMVPLNLLSPTEGGAYINTGTWSTKAIKEVKRCSNSFHAGSHRMESLLTFQQQMWKGKTPNICNLYIEQHNIWYTIFITFRNKMIFH